MEFLELIAFCLTRISHIACHFHKHVFLHKNTHVLCVSCTQKKGSLGHAPSPLIIFPLLPQMSRALQLHNNVCCIRTLSFTPSSPAARGAPCTGVLSCPTTKLKTPSHQRPSTIKALYCLNTTCSFATELKLLQHSL